MEVWTWIVAYIVGFSLLQLLVYRYFRDSEPSIEHPSPEAGEYAAGDRLERDDGRPRSDEDGAYCQHCGAFNEQVTTYRYCKQCVAPMR